MVAPESSFFKKGFPELFRLANSSGSSNKGLILRPSCDSAVASDENSSSSGKLSATTRISMSLAAVAVPFAMDP
jgi:hypothetical protein